MESKADRRDRKRRARERGARMRGKRSVFEIQAAIAGRWRRQQAKRPGDTTRALFVAPCPECIRYHGGPIWVTWGM